MIQCTCLLALLVMGNHPVAHDQDIRSKGDVENFNMALGFASTIQGLFVDKFIELVDDQKQEIDQIRERFSNGSKTIASGSGCLDTM